MELDLSVLQRAAELNAKVVMDIAPEVSTTLPTEEEVTKLDIDDIDLPNLLEFSETIFDLSMMYLSLAIPASREKEIAKFNESVSEHLNKLQQTGMQGAVRSQGLESACLGIAQDFRELSRQLKEVVDERGNNNS